MAANEIEILIKAVDKASKDVENVKNKLKEMEAGGKAGAKGVSSLSSAMANFKTKTDAVTKPFKDFVGGIGNLATAAAAVIGPVVAMGVAFKKAMDLGKEGAAALQTAESFDLLLKKVGAAPDLLDDLREASRGTITDLDLMSSTATLLAGAQGELATKLANATPELLKIAKAANKLNPALGDTTYQYNSLALGIKRASPMILDNLGLTIKIEEANKAYAESVGKTVEELTAEELKIALLNEVLRTGNVLIDQAGGNTDSMTDSFARLEVATTELKTAVGEKLAPVMANIAETIAGAITHEKDLNKAIRDTTGSYEEYVAGLEEYVTSSGYGIQTTAEAQFANEMYTESVYNSLKSVEDLNTTHEDFRLTGLSPTISMTEDAIETTDDLTAADDRLKTKLSDLKEIIAGPVGKAYDEFAEKSQTLIDKGLAGKEALEELTAKHEESTARIIFAYYEQELARDGLTDTEIDALIEIGKELGIYDEKTAEVMQSVRDSVATFNESGEMDQILGDVRSLNTELSNIPTKITIDIQERISQIGSSVGDTKWQGVEVKQHGGPVLGNMPYIIGERGPELFVPSQSGSIVPNHQITNINNWNLNATYPNQSQSSLTQEVRLLEMLYG